MRLTHEPTGPRIGDDEIHAFVDDVLDDSRRNELLAHIAVHPHEAERVNAYFRQRAALSALRAALSDDDDAAFCVDLQRRLQSSLHRQRGFRVMLRVAAAVAVLLPLGAGSWLAASHLRGGPAEQVASAVAPAFSAEFPFGGSFETAGLGSAASGAQAAAAMGLELESLDLAVPNLAALGLTLVAADEVADVSPPATRLVYSDELGNRLLVFIAPASSTAPQAMAVVPESHISLNWRSGPWVFALIAPMQMPNLDEVMRLVSQGGTEEAEASPEVRSVDAAPAVMPEVTAIPDPPVQILPADQNSAPIVPVTDEIGKEQPKVL
jgi:anti-sigma factor RsiW